jgi:hypothetical protein
MREVVPGGERPAAKNRRASRTAFRILSFFTAFVATAALTWRAGAFAVDVSGVARPNMTLDLIPRVALFRNQLKRDHARVRVAMVGDSMTFTDGPGVSMPEWVRRELVARQGKRRTGVHVLSWAAWGTAPEYSMVDEIAQAKPDLLVLELNLRLLGPAPLGAVSYPELSGHIANDRLFEAAFLPLSHAGVTLGRMLFYRGVVLTAHESQFSDVLTRQAMLFDTREPLEKWLDAKTHTRSYEDRRLAWGYTLSARYLAPGTRHSRDSLPHARDALGDVIDGIREDHPRLVVLRAMLRDFRRAGVPVLVWVSPINLDHLARLGLGLDGIERSMTTIQKAVEGSGARFVDLHALLHDDDFADAGDHYQRDGSPSGAKRVGQELGLAIAREEERLALQ